MVTPEDAATAAENALAALVEANAATPRLGDSYAVLGSLSAALVSLRQVYDQLASWHDDAAERATVTGGDARAGYRHAIMAAARLRQGAALLERATAHIDAAWADNGRITWQPLAGQAPTPLDPDRRKPPRRPRQLPPRSAFGDPGHGPSGHGHHHHGPTR